jgi:gamma-glutamyltranspeptidase/glutathione hydrolase
MVPETGMILHNRGRGFTLNKGHVNCLEPHKRPYHTLHPAMVMKDQRPFLVLGTPGADGQTQTVMQLINKVLDFGFNVQEAVEAPRWRSQPDGALMTESRFPEDVLRKLREKGHLLDMRPEWEGLMGSSQIIFIDQETGVLRCGADPRRQAYAIGR